MESAFQSISQEQIQSLQQKNILEDEAFTSASGTYKIPLGKNDSEELIVKNLEDLTHILVCGTTGSGKTSFVQTMLAVLCDNCSPDELRLVIYDCKGVDYIAFRKVKHLLLPIMIDQNTANNSIQWLIQESRNRLNEFAKYNTKDLASYNSRCSSNEKKPRIAVVLDDFSMLMLNKSEMSELLNVIKIGRTVGIHFIIVSSLTFNSGLQKELISNIPCKITFKLASLAESNAIIGQSGAELLRTPGEMLFRSSNERFKCQASYAQFENISEAMISQGVARRSIFELGEKASSLFSEYNSCAKENKVKENKANEAQINKSEPIEKEVKLRNFEEFEIGETELCVSDNKIKYTKRVIFKEGPGHITPEFKGNIIRKIVYKAPSIFSKGYFTFGFDSDISIGVNGPQILDVNGKNISDIMRVDFDSSNSKVVKRFLQQISEDTGIPITYK